MHREKKKDFFVHIHKNEAEKGQRKRKRSEERCEWNGNEIIA
jgi:hypothetical protein